MPKASPLVPSLPGNIATLPVHFLAGNPSRECNLEVSTFQAPQNQAEPLLARLLLMLWSEHRVDGIELHGLLAACGGDDAALAEFVPGIDGEELLSPAAGQGQAEVGARSEAGLHVAQLRFPFGAGGELETGARIVPRTRTPTRGQVRHIDRKSAVQRKSVD